MKWRKIGLIYNASGENESLAGYAAVPIAEHLEGDVFRIYFSSRDVQNRSFTNYVDVDLKEPSRILQLSEKPVISPGELGAFDDSGTMATWMTAFGDTRYLYYIGWNLGVTVPFRNSVGVCISEKGSPFRKMYKGPILDRTKEEPHFCASCSVLRESEGWKMWYLNCTGWFNDSGKTMHRYHLKYAESSDGLNWVRPGIVAIDYESECEYAISRPSVIKEGGVYKMWFSSRGTKEIPLYRIRYAESLDGRMWTRKPVDFVGLDVSPSGWDSEMVCYPHVFDHKGKRYMLYNGNGYGRTGFGLAVLEEE